MAHEQLEKPLPPPRDHFDAPQLPPKPRDLQPPQLPPVGGLSSLSLDGDLPVTPTSPTTPETTKKKTNPLTDLIDTEKGYVDLLTAIIRKVAAAWSRSNLPPKELDTMFRAIESVYKANRQLLSKLKDIGPNPSSPKALGDLLMKWRHPMRITRSSTLAALTNGVQVADNARLPNILNTLTTNFPPPNSDSGPWTLDSLFLLPKTRLKYYRKLYSRLLKSTSPGRNDHKLLAAAVEKLEFLLDTLDSRADIRVGESGRPSSTNPTPRPAEDEVVIDLRTQSVIAKTNNNLGPVPPPKRTSDFESESSSARGSSLSETQRSSSGTSWTQSRRGSSNTMNSPISDLERRLATERTLDIFTMKPKVVKLQMTPPTLTFKRELRCSVDVTVRFTPKATGQEWVHQRGHIFLLSDLFLLCERMTPEERADGGPDGPDMWLSYPPLAGKVLRVYESQTQENVLEVAIMRKETLFIQTENQQMLKFLLGEFKECIEFASSLPPPSKDLPPPVPPIPPTQTSPRNSEQLMSPRSTNNSPHSSLASPPPNMLRSSASSPGPPGPPRQMGPGDMMPPPRSTSSASLPGPPPRMGGPPGPPLQAPQPQFAGPPGSQFRNGSPGPSFQNGPPGPPFQNGPPGPPFQNGPPGPPFHNGPPGPPFHNGPPGPPFHNGPPGPPFHNGPPGPPFHNGPPFQNGPPGSQFGGPPFNGPPPPRPPSEPGQPPLRSSPSTRSLNSLPQDKPMPPPPHMQRPPLPGGPGGPPPNGFGPGPGPPPFVPGQPLPRPVLPSLQQPGQRAVSMADHFDAPSPPDSPVHEMPKHTGPVTTTVSAQMKCKVFLKQHHAQWKNLGAAKLKLYRQDPTNIKQLVVEADSGKKNVLISTIVLSDGVERVGKTGVAIELSDEGKRTGIVYMIQLRNENSAGGLFDSLLAGSDRTVAGGN
ncbi:hypothetical protein DL96DRAFT_1702156 [Flagelloscypha sp. PMI_526]|nr:hypothetical protein DL96DRAFT_1702156 [Flagelloscypha sp. PMI_526]